MAEVSLEDGALPADEEGAESVVVKVTAMAENAAAAVAARVQARDLRSACRVQARQPALGRALGRSGPRAQCGPGGCPGGLRQPGPRSAAARLPTRALFFPCPLWQAAEARAAALRNLATTADTKLKAAAAGGVRPVVAAMSAHLANADVQARS